MDNKQRLFASNKRAKFDYFLIETFECGIVLLGGELPSIKQGAISIVESYVTIENDELILVGCHIHQYKNANKMTEIRPRKLLMHRKEIRGLKQEIKTKGLTLIPIDFHMANGKIKVTIALAKGKKNYDKRVAIKERDIDRETRLTD